MPDDNCRFREPSPGVPSPRGRKKARSQRPGSGDRPLGTQTSYPLDQRISISVREASLFTGVPEHTIRRALGTELPYYDINQKSKALLVSELVAWLERHRRGPSRTNVAAESPSALTAEQQAAGCEAERQYRELMGD